MANRVRRTTLTLLTLFAAAGPACAALPLPAGAAVRFGSTRFLYDGWLSDVAYSPDGRTLITGAVSMSGPNAGQSQLIFWNAATGEKRYESAFEQGTMFNVIASPDGRTIATHSTGRRPFAIYDAASGKLLRKVGEQSSGSPIFSPDGKMLAGASGNAIQLLDIATGDEQSRLEGHTSTITWIGWSSNGKHVASVGSDHTLRLWDVETGEILQQHEDEERRWMIVDFSADGKSVAATAIARNLGKGGDLIAWDVASGEETLRVPVAADTQGFMFTADGKWLVIAELNSAEVREAATGKLVRRFDLGGPHQRSSWTVSLDGRTLAVGASGCVVHQWDLATGTLKDNQPGHRFPIISVEVVADGSKVLTLDKGGNVRLWDPAIGRELRRQQEPKDLYSSIRFMPDGQSLHYQRLVEENAVGLINVETGKERSRFKLPVGERRSMVMTPAGALLALETVNAEGISHVGIWEVGTGKKRSDLEKVPNDLVAHALSRDGTQYVGAISKAILVWDTTTGRLIRTIVLDEELYPFTLRFSADGRRLLGAGSGAFLGSWETDTGRRVLSTKIDGDGIYSVALSPDGRTIAVSPLQDGKEPSTVILLEAATGQERGRLNGHFTSGVGRAHFTPHAMAFTPDGRSLITTGIDTTALVWPLPFRTGERALPRRATDLPPLWEALAAAEGERAYGALADLAAVPALAVPMLREQLTPIRPLDDKARKQISLWIADLDSDDFTTREKAATSLEKLEELAAPALRKAMANDPSAEVKRHLTHLLDRLAVHPPVTEVLRAIRAVETLERIATPEARKLLEELAAGASEAYRTREAMNALARLNLRMGK